MAQLNVYLPDERALRLRKEAKKAGLSLSRYVVRLLDHEPSSGADAWPPDYFTNVCGFLIDDDDFVEPPDLPPEPVLGLDTE